MLEAPIFERLEALERVYHSGIELPTTLLLDIDQSVRHRPGFLIRTHVGESVKSVSYGHDARAKGNLFSFETFRVALLKEPGPYLHLRFMLLFQVSPGYTGISCLRKPTH